MEKINSLDAVKVLIVNIALRNTDFTINEFYEMLLCVLESKVDKVILESNSFCRIVKNTLNTLVEEGAFVYRDGSFWNRITNDTDIDVLVDVVKEKTKRNKNLK